MADRLDVLLGILLDKTAQRDTERGLVSIEEEIDKLGDAAGKTTDSMSESWDALSEDFEKFTRLFSERFKRVNGELIDLATGSKATADALRDFTKIDVDSPARDFASISKNSKEAAEEIARARAEERALEQEIRKVAKVANLPTEAIRDLPEEIYQAGVRAAELKDKMAQATSEVARLNQAAAGIQRVSTILVAAGGAIVGGIAASAIGYVRFVEQAGIKGDETADRWIAATKRVQNAQLNLGEKAAQVLLPIYEQAAELAEKAAAFVDKNPDLVRAALNTGLVVATLGAVGVAVSRGIKLYADFKYLAATAEYSLATTRFENAVRAYLTGAALPNARTAAGGAAAGGALGKAGAALGTVTLIASAVVIGTQAGAAIGNALGKLVYGENYKKQGLGDAALTATRVAQLPALLGSQGLQALGQYNPLLAKLGEVVESNIMKADSFMQRLLGLEKAADDAEGAVDDVSSGLRDFQNEAEMSQATGAYIQYRQQEAQAEEQYVQQRAQIVAQGLAQIAQIEANYARQRAQFVEQFASSQAQAVANFQFQQAQAAEQFAFSEAQAIQNYNEQRAELREEFQENEERSREDHLREMRRLEEEHQDRVRDLVAARDALGLVREKRDYARQVRDAEEEYNIERARRRKDFNNRLRDMEEEFQQERERRRAEFEFRQQQAAEQFAYQQEQARKQFEERLAQMDEEHRLELERTRQQTAQRLRELELQFRQEQVTRRNAFYDILRDLNANLLNERDLRNQYYARMQQDLLRFLQSATPSQTNLPGYQHGGYTPEGPIRAHRGEYVLDRETTKAMESLVGGRLTKEGLQAITAGASTTSTLNLSFPGGLVTIKELEKILDQRDGQFLRKLTRGLV